MSRRLAVAVLTMAAAACNSPSSARLLNAEGTYAMQFNASSSCRLSLPANARNRSYNNIVVTQSSRDVTMTMNTFAGVLPVVMGAIDGDEVIGAVQLFDFNDGYQVMGQVRFAVRASGLGNGTVNGAISTGTAVCTAANHQIIVTGR